MIDKKTLKSIYHAIFESHLFSSCLVWAQNTNSIKRLYISQNKFLRLMYLLNHNTHTAPLFGDSNILKFPDKIDLENCIFIKKYFNQTLPTLFKNWFNHSTDSHTLFVVKAENICWNTIKMHKTMVTELSEVNLYFLSILAFWKKLITFIEFVDQNIRTCSCNKELLKNIFFDSNCKF